MVADTSRGRHSYFPHGAGNGAQWPQMGADLLRCSATFRASMAASAAAAAALGVALMAEFEAPHGFTHASRAGIGIIAVQVHWQLSMCVLVE